MDSDVYEDTESVPSPRAIKVHRVMCTELIQLVNKVSGIFPEIEAARPSCSSGIEALSLLNNAMIKAKLILHNCAMSSTLYLAIIGKAILSRCNKSKELLEQSLSQIQNMAPVLLAAKMSQVISDLRKSIFSLDPHDELAGKVLMDLIQRYGSDHDDSVKETALQAIQVAAMKLHINSKKALLNEKRSIKKQLDAIGETNPQKKNLLLFLHKLLKKYGNLIITEQKDNGSLHLEVKSYEFGESNQAQIGVLPEEYKCPLSLRLMYDPVIIASGKTYEKMWIQKWFDEGQDTCPETKTKLSHLIMTPNTTVKDLITKWCTANNVTLSDPSLLVKRQLLDTSSSSISSLSSTMMANLSVHLDLSGISIGSSDGRQDSDSFHSRSFERSKKFDNSEIDPRILFEFESLPWGSRCKLVKDIERSLNNGYHSCGIALCENLASSILKFLKDSVDFLDVKAQKNGCLLFLALLRNCRSSISYLEDETYTLLASFLDSDAANESLAVFEELYCHDAGVDSIAASNTLIQILHILTKDITKLQEPALKLLLNFSANPNITPFIKPMTIIPVLLPSLENTSLARYGISIIENLCYRNNFRVFVAETDGCISSISRLLESTSYSEQEKSVGVLLSLCCQSVEYCDLVLDEGVIPSLVNISNNGTTKGQAMATELLRLLRDQIDVHEESNVSKHLQKSDHSAKISKERKVSSKGIKGIFKKFSRH